MEKKAPRPKKWKEKPKRVFFYEKVILDTYFIMLSHSYFVL